MMIMLLMMMMMLMMMIKCQLIGTVISEHYISRVPCDYPNEENDIVLPITTY